ncbi:MAG: 16S rRNA (adenine(1518)-N(6)/adenine(1519)-N(6))-dimethyltransferase RsmA, partial [Pseudomonadota bacterium]
MAFDGLPPLRDVIARAGLRARKSLGQNFIMDLNLTSRIAALGQVADRTVIEIGPGPGGLTRALLADKPRRVIAIERDDRCCDVLAQISHHYPGRLDVVMADALSFSAHHHISSSDDGLAVIVANLPYGIATPLIVKWLEAEPWPTWWDKAVLMFQKEVAERIVAQPNTKSYGRLAVLAQRRCEVDIALHLPPSAFTPAPKVSSSVVVFKPQPIEDGVAPIHILQEVTAAAF